MPRHCPRRAFSRSAGRRPRRKADRTPSLRSRPRHHVTITSPRSAANRHNRARTQQAGLVTSRLSRHTCHRGHAGRAVTVVSRSRPARCCVAWGDVRTDVALSARAASCAADFRGPQAAQRPAACAGPSSAHFSSRKTQLRQVHRHEWPLLRHPRRPLRQRSLPRPMASPRAASTGISAASIARANPARTLI